MSTTIVTKPAVLMNRPTVDSAGNRLQQVRLLFACGHVEESFRLNMNNSMPTNARLMREELAISCPAAYKLCRQCSEATS
jgi:hypothetical protein